MPYNDATRKLAAEDIAIRRIDNMGTLENLALRRWEMHEKAQYQKELELALKFYLNQVKDLGITDTPEEDVTISKISELREQFINGIDNIMKEVEEAQYVPRREKVLTFRKQSLEKSASKGQDISHSPWGDVNEETAIKTADVLTEATLDQLKPRAVSIAAPMTDLVDKLASKGFYNLKGKPIGNRKMLNLSDVEIVECYTSLMHGILNYYKPADNLSKVKGLVVGLRESCARTLARKHKKTLRWVYHTYTEDIKVQRVDGKPTNLPDRKWLNNFSKGFHLQEDQGFTKEFDADAIMKRYQLRLHVGGRMFSRCSVEGCLNEDVEIHHERKLHRKVETDGNISVVSATGRRLKSLGAIMSAINRKQLPLCKKHHLEFEKGDYSHLDGDYLADLLKSKIPDADKLRSAFAEGIYTRPEKEKGDSVSLPKQP